MNTTRGGQVLNGESVYGLDVALQRRPDLPSFLATVAGRPDLRAMEGARFKRSNQGQELRTTGTARASRVRLELETTRASIESEVRSL